MRIATLIATVVLGAGVVSAQSLGDVARQERVRRAGLEKHSRVLTNEDLSRQQILAPEVKEAAARPAEPSPAPVPRATAPAPVASRPAVAAPLAPQPEAQEVSLGDYARAVRAERARREARAQTAEAKSEPPPPAPAEQRPWVKDDSGVPAWTAAEQPGFSLGEYAREQRALPRKGVPVQLTLDAKAAPAAAAPPMPSLNANHNRRSSPSSSPVPPAASPAEAILVQKGDSLWKLSRAHLGEGRLWPAIWAANPQVRNPHLIHPGQSLSRPTEVEVAQARHAISSKPAVIAKLAPAPLPLAGTLRAARLRSVRLQPGGDHGKAINGQVNVPAGLVLPARRVRISSPAADCKRPPAGARHYRAAPQLPSVERAVLPDLPGHLGLRSSR